MIPIASLMTNLVASFLPITIVIALWFAPILLIYKVAKAAKKNTSHVLLGGLLLGWVGAGLVALISAPMSAADFAAMHPAKASGSRQPLDSTKIFIGAILLCGLIFAAFMVFIASL